MNRGDTFNVHVDGKVLTVCVLGFYNEEYSGEEMVILAVVNQDNLVHVPLDDINAIIPQNKFLN
ncbi:hypothetical protein SYNTR_0153 [Candidatus Syntrophocurvum alkaliphilum]|uniref:Uncharacterized protein n=1 Tax=Candidatus Syntrophocurvum alkaliphilum TaxID=2293317 RepID=A0A6I6D5W5_9FIRM|nr:hypothetical protein [Candidatus Syntrophocurvum alkaliphilum]QGT98746.1 hypothetical protein SYNTR_0153 [Candidatus Syntrophocurvum alkaliphilum]